MKTASWSAASTLKPEEFSSVEIASLEATNSDLKIPENSRYGISIRQTRPGTILLGTFALDTPGHSLSNEIRGTIIDLMEPAVLVYLRNGRKVLLNLLTGAELTVPRNSGIEATSQGLFLWTPARSPKEAALYTYGAFRTLNRWSASDEN